MKEPGSNCTLNAGASFIFDGAIQQILSIKIINLNFSL